MKQPERKSDVEKYVLRHKGERIDLSKRSESGRWQRLFVYAACFAIMLAKAPFPTFFNETEDGKSVFVINLYPGFVGYVKAESPTWQRRSYDDGTVSKGPMRDHKRDGLWQFDEGDRQHTMNFENGQPHAGDRR